MRRPDDKRPILCCIPRALEVKFLCAVNEPEFVLIANGAAISFYSSFHEPRFIRAKFETSCLSTLWEAAPTRRDLLTPPKTFGLRLLAQSLQGEDLTPHLGFIREVASPSWVADLPGTTSRRPPVAGRFVSRTLRSLPPYPRRGSDSERCRSSRPSPRGYPRHG